MILKKENLFTLNMCFEPSWHFCRLRWKEQFSDGLMSYQVSSIKNEIIQCILFLVYFHECTHFALPASSNMFLENYRTLSSKRKEKLKREIILSMHFKAD